MTGMLVWHVEQTILRKKAIKKAESKLLIVIHNCVAFTKIAETITFKKIILKNKLFELY